MELGKGGVGPGVDCNVGLSAEGDKGVAAEGIFSADCGAKVTSGVPVVWGAQATVRARIAIATMGVRTCKSPFAFPTAFLHQSVV